MTKTKILLEKEVFTSEYSSLTFSFEFCKKDLFAGLYWEDEFDDPNIKLDLYFVFFTLVFHIRHRDWRWIERNFIE